MFVRLVPLLLLSTLAACHRPAPPAATQADIVDLDPVTQGRRIKIVWAQSATAGTADIAAQGQDLLLVGLDSKDGKGPRPLLPSLRNIFKPLLSPDGSEVVFTDRFPEPHILSVNWQSGEISDLGPGVAVATWAEAGVPIPWIYALEEIDQAARGGLMGKRLVRFTRANPTDREIIWTQTPMDADGFQLSRDATHASGLLPSPEASILTLPDGKATKLASASWPMLAPDNSYVISTLDPEQSTLTLRAPQQDEPWNIIANTSGGRIWHPRWSNNPGVIAFTGPYPIAPNHPTFKDNPHSLGGEIFIARMGASATQLLSVVQVTHNDRGDVYPDVWVENSFIETLASFPQKPAEREAAPPPPWPSTTDSVQFAFNNASKDTPLPTPGGTRLCRLTPRQSAHLGRFWDLDISRGYFETDPTTSAAIAQSIAASHAFTLEFLLTESRDGYQPLSIRLLSYRRTDGSEALGLYRVDNQLVMRLRLGTTPADSRVHPVKLIAFRIENDRSTHLVLTLNQGRITTYVNGSIVSETLLEIPTLAGWDTGVLQLGDPQPFGGQAWTGSLENVLIASTALPEATLQLHADSAQRKSMQRKSIDRIKLQATLEEISPLPASTTDGPYPRVLTTRTYRVDRVEAGVLQDKSILVLHDTALNRQPLPDLPSVIGQPYTLLVEPASQHPELKAAEIINDSKSTDLPLYLEVTPPPRLP